MVGYSILHTIYKSIIKPMLLAKYQELCKLLVTESTVMGLELLELLKDQNKYSFERYK